MSERDAGDANRDGSDSESDPRSVSDLDSSVQPEPESAVTSEREPASESTMTPDGGTRFGSALKLRLSALGSVTRLGQFASVGVVGAVVDNGVLFGLVELGLLGFVPAKVAAWIVTIGVIFTINERWTFARFGPFGVRAIGRRLFRSYVVRFGGFVVTISVYTALVHGVGIWYIAANVVGIGVGFVVNYVFESLFTWKVHRQ